MRIDEWRSVLIDSEPYDKQWGIKRCCVVINKFDDYPWTQSVFVSFRSTAACFKGALDKTNIRSFKQTRTHFQSNLQPVLITCLFVRYNCRVCVYKVVRKRVRVFSGIFSSNLETYAVKQTRNTNNYQYKCILISVQYAQSGRFEKKKHFSFHYFSILLLLFFCSSLLRRRNETVQTRKFFISIIVQRATFSPMRDLFDRIIGLVLSEFR